MMSELASTALPASLRAMVLRRIAESHAQTIEMLVELLAIPSPVGKEGDAQAWVERQLRALGLEIDRFELDPAIYGHLPGWLPNERDHRGRPNIIGVWRGTGGGRSLILNAHIDTVPAAPEELWSSDPWVPRTEGNRVYARGSHDDKAGIIEIIAALRALRESGWHPEGDIIVQSVIEDEPTGNGTLACTARGYTADAAWVVDGTHNGLAIVNHTGQIQFEITVYGAGGSIVEAGGTDDAIELARGVSNALKQLAEVKRAQPPASWWPAMENPLHFAVSRITGGEWFASKPAKCVLECCMAFTPPDTLEGIKAEIEEALRTHAAAHPWLAKHPPQLRFAGLATEPVHLLREEDPFFHELGRVYKETTGMPLRWITLDAWCDLRHFNIGRYTPAILSGPGNGGGDHGPDEWIDTDSMLPVVQAIAAFTLEWCGAGNNAEEGARA